MNSLKLWMCADFFGEETIIVIGSYAGRHYVTGKVFRSPAAHVYDVGDGKVSRFRQFTDTKVIWDAMN